ncbi:MAG TPA: N-acetylmuramoyl-L-alanine amidase [Ferruginibacter sp.]|nr:N-acetylmuramoyl-L-alanine amidase [Chitinophagaceae bacterium]HMT96739.1 N-acetylmuramoyl-L-alanine amidase [Ferruginibacter sp.]
MKRHIRYIVVHSTATFEPKVSQFYGNYHYVVERNGEIKKVHADASIIKNVEKVDNEAIHIAYAGGRNKSGTLGDTKTPNQEEALFNKIVALSIKYPSAAIVGHDELEPGSISPGFNVKEWIRNYEPDLNLSKAS